MARSATRTVDDAEAEESSSEAPGNDRRPSPGPLLRTFDNIASAWGLGRRERMTLLGVDSTSTYAKWRRTPDEAVLKLHTIERLSYVFGIYKALQLLMPRGEGADGWPSRPNTDVPFGGSAPLELMLTGFVGDLQRVRAYLDGERNR